MSPSLTLSSSTWAACPSTASRPAAVLTAALDSRFDFRDVDDFADKALSAISRFGEHDENQRHPQLRYGYQTPRWKTVRSTVESVPDNPQAGILMEIQVNTDHNVDLPEARIADVEFEVGAVLARFADHITRVEVHLSDESAGRSSGQDKRCMLEARPAGRTPVAVTDHAATVDEALRGALQKLKRLLDGEPTSSTGHHARDSIRSRQRRGRP